MKKRVLLVGLDEPEYLALRARVDALFVFHPSLPAVTLRGGALLVESRASGGRLLPVDAVIFHGIFDDDLAFLTALALWGGPCLPGATGLLDGRLRMACLARAMRVSRFARAPRGLLAAGERFVAERPTVAKWGDRHCGENKVCFTGPFVAEAPTLLEPFFEGEAVRVVLVGERSFQLRLGGDDWLKSIHHPGAAFIAEDPELVADTRALAARFDLPLVGVDYIRSAAGDHHLLEVNHVPNVTVFPPIREAFLDLAQAFIEGLPP